MKYDDHVVWLEAVGWIDWFLRVISESMGFGINGVLCIDGVCEENRLSLFYMFFYYRLFRACFLFSPSSFPRISALIQFYPTVPYRTLRENEDVLQNRNNT